MANGKEKAAIFLSVLGSEYSGKVVEHLPSDVSDAIAEVLTKRQKKASADEVSGIIDEFKSKISSGKYEQEQVPAQGQGMSSSDIISRASPERVAKVLMDERPEFIAFVLSHLPVEKIHEILLLLGNIRKDVEERLLHMKDVPMTDVFQEQVLDIVAKRLM